MKCDNNIPANICGQEVTVDTHDYILDEVVTDCTVEILKCRKCGELSIGWYRQGVKHDLTTKGVKD